MEIYVITATGESLITVLSLPTSGDIITVVNASFDHSEVCNILEGTRLRVVRQIKDVHFSWLHETDNIPQFECEIV